MKTGHTGQEFELRVVLWGTEIGRLSWNSTAGRSHFFFSPEYFGMAPDIAPIIAPKNSPESRFAIYGNTENRIYQKLPPFIADALPDDWGNTLFEKWFKDNGYHEKDKTPLAKLSFIGRRAKGALEFFPCQENGFDAGAAIDLDKLCRLASRIEQERENTVISPGETLTVKALLSVGTTAGGRYKKAVIAIAPDGSIHSGQLSVNPGWRYCIVKFNNPSVCLSEMEKTYYDMATSAGIDMMRSELIEIDGTRHFLTDRFDRTNGEKRLTMSLAAINPDACSYEQLFHTCTRIGIPETEKSQLYRRMVFNILASNTDDHSKNIEFVLDKDGTWHIAPAYDMNFILRTLNSAETEHCTTLNGKRSSFTKKELLQFAKEYNIRSAERIIAEVRRAISAFEELATTNGVRGDIAELVSRHLSKISNELDGLEPEKDEWPSFSVDGHDIQSFRFQKDENGAIRIMAEIDGKPAKYILTEKHPDFLLVADKFNNSSDQFKKTVIKRFLLSNTGADPSVIPGLTRDPLFSKGC